MDFNKLFIIILIFSVVISLNCVSALETNIENCTGLIQDPTSSIDIQMEYEDVLSEGEINNADNSYLIYVGQNTTDDGGNGSYENPFSTLDLACSDVKEYKECVTVNIFEGTYYLDTIDKLTFNTSNLNIQSVNGTVILKNLYNEKTSKLAFGVTEPSANFTMSNITFDASEWTRSVNDRRFFTPFYGDDSLNGIDNVVFNNCTFIGYIKTSMLPYSDPYTYTHEDTWIFNSCKFVNYTYTKAGFCVAHNWKGVYFNYCIITANFATFGAAESQSTIFNDIWWGQNNITGSYFYNSKGQLFEPTANYEFGRYAIFGISENYLGNNQYEIIGKLMWNDTTDEDIGKLGPMTVTLSSSSGDLPETAILQDGTFRVIYNSTASTHDVTAKLDKEIIPLKFNTTTLFVESSEAIFGQNQNITVTLPQTLNGTISINVNNKTYEVPVNNADSITCVIPDVLPVGKYDVTVTFVDEIDDETCAIHGFNTTAITVSKSSQYDFDATITPNAVYIGDDATVTLLLPNGATGNVTVKVGENEAKTFNVSDVITINDFVIGNNVVNITYNGNDNYDAKSIVKNIIATNVTISREGNLVPGEKLIIKVEIPYATGKVTIIVNGDKNTTELVDNVTTYSIDELVAGSYYVTVLYEGDDLFDFACNTDSFDVVKSTADLIKELNETIAGKDAEISVLNETVNNQSEVIAGKDAEISVLNETVNNQSEVIAGKDAEISVLNETVNNQSEVIAGKDAEISVLNETVNNQSEVIAGKDAEISVLNETVNNQSEVIAGKDAEISVLNETVNNQSEVIAGKDAEISVLNETVNNQSEVIAGKDAEISVLNETVNNQSEVIAGKDAEISVLNETVNNQSEVIAGKDAEISVLNETVNNQSEVIAGKDAEISVLNETVKAQDSTIESQKDLINNFNETIIEQNKTINKTSNLIVTSILVKDITTIATSTEYFIISLIDANNNTLANKTIEFTVNGKTDNVTTNGSGIATVKVSYSTAGTRYYTFSFLGEVGYSASIATAKVVVNKKATKITAPKKTFKVKTKTKKVQVKLTTGKTVLKNKKVTLKVKGKTYTAKTNSKGIATLKVTKLTKKGTFKYTVKFAGDKAYKAVSKNGKIIIK